MYYKINKIILLSCIIINAHAMENEFLLPSLIADVSRELDTNYKGGRCKTMLLFSNDVIVDKKKFLKQQYKSLCETKKKEQQINFPEEQKGYSVNTLSLNNQSIKTILFDLPLHIQKEHIQHIDISHNDLEDLPLVRIIETMPNLKTLNASHNKIAYISLYRHYIQSKSHELEELNISNNALKDVNVGDFLCAYSNLKNLDLSGNPIESITWFEKICSPIEYPTINFKNIILSNDAKKNITKNYIKCLQASSLQEIELNSAVRGVFAGLSWFGTANTWAWWEIPDYSVAAVFAPTVLLAGMGYYLSKIYYSNSKQQELDGIENKAPQHLLFDNDTDTTDTTINM